MRVLIDLHHHDLFHSLLKLFEDRLGYECYTQVGLDWRIEDYWQVYDHPATAQQYLSLDGAFPYDSHKNILDYPKNKEASLTGEGIYLIKDQTKDLYYKGITLKAFKDTKFDLLISSIPAHIERFNNLIKRFQPQAKHIFQVGNAWGQLSGVTNILASTAPFSVSTDINVCFYHQEFSTELFSPQEFKEKQVNSYIHYMQRKDLMNQVALILEPKGFKFKSYGAGMEDCLLKTKDIAQAYKDSMFTWHYKPEGDGYGYGLFYSYACGKPAIVKKSFYTNKLAEKLLTDRETCLTIDGLTPGQIAQKIAHYSSPNNYRALSNNALERFKQTVDFNKDFEEIKLFLEKLR